MRPRYLVERSGEIAEILSLLGNEKRLTIMFHLLEEELCVGEISDRVSLSQSALSQHLAKLRAGGLVETRRVRQNVYYRCSPGPGREFMQVLASTFAPAK